MKSTVSRLPRSIDARIEVMASFCARSGFNDCRCGPKHHVCRKYADVTPRHAAASGVFLTFLAAAVRFWAFFAPSPEFSNFSIQHCFFFCPKLSVSSRESVAVLVHSRLNPIKVAGNPGEQARTTGAHVRARGDADLGSVVDHERSTRVALRW